MFLLKIALRLLCFKVIDSYLVVLFNYSFLRLDLSWKDIGRYKHMSQKSFGLSTALMNQMDALLSSAGCKIQRFYGFDTFMVLVVSLTAG